MKYQMLAETKKSNNQVFEPHVKVVFKHWPHKEIFEYQCYSESQNRKFMTLFKANKNRFPVGAGKAVGVHKY